MMERWPPGGGCARGGGGEERGRRRGVDSETAEGYWRLGEVAVGAGPLGQIPAVLALSGTCYPALQFNGLDHT